MSACRELLEKIERTYDLCLQRCGASRQVIECLVDCMKVAKPLRDEYLHSGCDESYLPL